MPVTRWHYTEPARQYDTLEQLRWHHAWPNMPTPTALLGLASAVAAAGRRASSVSALDREIERDAPGWLQERGGKR